jgi:hypothetical protein
MALQSAGGVEEVESVNRMSFMPEGESVTFAERVMLRVFVRVELTEKLLTTGAAVSRVIELEMADVVAFPALSRYWAKTYFVPSLADVREYEYDVA